MAETFLWISKYIWVTIWDTRMTYFKNIISIFYIYFGFILVLAVLLPHKYTLIEYSTVVEYSAISKLDFFIFKIFLGILFPRSKTIHDDAWWEKISRSNDQTLLIRGSKIDTSDQFFEPPKKFDPPLCRHIGEVYEHSVLEEMFS